MGIFSRFMQSRGWHKTGVTDAPFLLAMASGERYAIPDPSLPRNQADLFRRVSWVVSACNIIAQSAAAVPLRVKKRVSEEGLEDVPNHPFEELLMQPNPLDTYQTFIESIVLWYQLTGNDYVWQNAASDMSPPDELWPVPPYYIVPEPDGQLYLAGYKYQCGGYEQMLPVAQVSHMKSWNPSNRFVGMSKVEPLAKVATTYMKQQDYNRNLFTDDGKPPGMLWMSKPYNDSDAERFKRELAKHGGTARSLMVTWNMAKDGAGWLPFGFTPKDMEFSQAHESARREIYETFGVPVGLFSELAGKASGDTAMAVFRNLTLWPMLQRIAGRFTRDILVPRYGQEYVCEFDDVRMSDEQLELNKLTTYMQFMPIGRLLTMVGQEPIGDERDDLLVAEIPKGKGDTFSEEAQPVTPPQLLPFTGQQPEPEQEAEEPEEEEIPPAKCTNHLRLWRAKALRLFGETGTAVCPFKSDVIPPEIQNSIPPALALADTPQAVKAVFEDWLREERIESALDELALALRDA